MFFANCVFENDIFLSFSRIYDVIKIIVMTYFLLIAYLKMTYFADLQCHKIITMSCFLLIAYLKMTYLCIFYNVVFIDPTIKIIRITSPFNKVFIFVFSNNFFYNIYFRSVFRSLQFPFIENSFYYLTI